MCAGNPNFFLGTDSAPHFQGAKESSYGCAGVYTDHAALQLHAEVFDNAGCLPLFDTFALKVSLHSVCLIYHFLLIVFTHSRLTQNGATFYGLEPKKGTMKLFWQLTLSPDCYPVGGGKVVPLRAGGSVEWTLVGDEGASRGNCK